MDDRNEKINYKVREHSLAKIPFIIVCGKKEITENTVTVRKLGSDKQEVMKRDKLIKNMFPNDEIIFANGGDRNQENIPEMTEEGIQFLFGIGGNFKKNSSSSILDEWVDFIQKNKG